MIGINKPTPEEIAWAGGLFEGEGCFSIMKSSQGTRIYEYPRAVLSMTDEDTVKRFFDIVGVGKLFLGNERNRGQNEKPIFGWRATKREEVKHVYFLLAPWLGTRRRLKGLEVITCPGRVEEVE